MVDPRTPPTGESQLPDALDQVPDAHPGQGLFGEAHGSEDAQLLSGAEPSEGDVEQAAASDDPGTEAP
jgi:hypothetical protein